MAHYATCLNCAVDQSACQRRANLRDAMKGQHVYSLKFKCSDRRPMFAAGQRIEFDWVMWEQSGDDDEGLPLVFNGTVLRERGTKFVVQVDRNADASGEGIKAEDVFKNNDQLLIKVRPASMRPIDEPTRSVCGVCYRVEGVAEDRCYRIGDGWTPVGCTQDSAVLP
ncbi:hypothetical protein ACHMW7_16050 [Aminobacter sp. UC22_36]|uniref:hypothetical protein n=1 Tax=Aminobacter sp. UC22_36 TaxID=3374549 RepID=UPI0037580E40